MSSILIVDDDEINSKMLAKRLSKRGHEVTTVSSGYECLEYIQNEIPDLILLDILMPELSGIEVLESLRKTYSAIDIPIIMVTSKSDASDIVSALRAGANDYIQKPVQIEIAEARIHSQINSVRNYREALEKKELESLNNLISTYNHEINNPLTIAYGYLRKAKKEQSLEYFDRISDALFRVTNIVKEIERITSLAPGKKNQSFQ